MRAGDLPLVTMLTERLELTPLVPEDADEMAEVLADERLYEFTGGGPVDAERLRARYERMVAGSGRDDETWMNWVVRRRSDRRPVGTVQATVVDGDGRRTAVVAWVIGVPWQGQGFATEAARAIVGWLEERDVDEIVANIHPGHAASATVATRIELTPTDDLVDGERVWRRVVPRSGRRRP